jgi:acyl-CoA thioesterase-1
MPHRRLLLILLLAGAFLRPGPAAGQGRPVRIMPLGDSITEGRGWISEAQPGFASYRYWLWHELLDRGHDVDFVGSQYGVWNGDPRYTDFDLDHEGHWGWRACDVLPEIAGWTEAARPDVVLIHLGHNDLWQGESIAGTIDELGGIIDEIRSVNPRAVMLLARVITSAFDNPDSLPELNDMIDVLGAEKHTAASPVLVVDHETGFDPWLMTYDSVHPNETGEQFMAQRWLAPLDSLLTTWSGVAAVPGAGSAGALLAVAPNPFNPMVNIKLVIPRAGRAVLQAYDARGRLAATLLDAHSEAGEMEVTWQGRDDAGRSLPSGVYHLRLTAGGATAASRVTLLR